jgi:hypothetical protein
VPVQRSALAPIGYCAAAGAVISSSDSKVRMACLGGVVRNPPSYRSAKATCL